MQGAGRTREFYLAGGGAPVARERKPQGDAEGVHLRATVRTAGPDFSETSPVLGKRAGAQFG